MLAAIRDFVREPRPKFVEHVPLDRRVLPGVAAVSLISVYIDTTLPNKLGPAIVAIATTYAMRWLRTHAVWLAVAISLLNVALWEWGAGFSMFGFAMSVYTLAAVYALARWGSGREIILGSAVVLVASMYPNLDQGIPRTDLVVFALWSLYPLGFGLAARSNARERQHTLTAARLNERHEIARELHDTVAHHVSAITIQAQAARTILETKPDTAREVLEIIEEQAARTLDEMRRMVTVLRDTEMTAEMRPQSGLADIAELATASGTGPKVEVTFNGDLDHLAPSLEASLFRLVQEGVTNARRHARDATRIRVEIIGSDEQIELTVTDDGQPLNHAPPPGFGLTGLAERVTQHGGTFSAGPAMQGWTISASFPYATAP